jgi:hypothetical protein
VANVSPADYINDINTLRTYFIGTSGLGGVNSTDISRGASAGISLKSPTLIPGNVGSTGFGTSGLIDGSQIRDVFVWYFALWSDSRTVTFNRITTYNEEQVEDVADGTGSPGAPAAYAYNRYAYITAPNPAYNGPLNTDARWDPLDAGEDIDQSDWDSIVSGMFLSAAIYKSSIFTTVNYCHSSCHASCHTSRGRR